MLWSSIQNQRDNIKINAQFRKDYYNWVLQHLQVLQTSISNDCLKVSIGSYTEKQVNTKLSLQVPVRELHNSIVIPPEEGVIKESRD